MDELRKEIKDIKRQINQLSNYGDIPYDTIEAIKARLSFIEGEVSSITQETLERTISLSGDAENIKVLDYPDGFVTLTFGTNKVKVPYYND